MNFTGITFLYFFLPCFFAVYALAKPAMRAYVMLAGSLVVIGWGGLLGLIPLAVCILTAYLCGAGCERLRENKALSALLLWICLLTDAAAVVLFVVLPGKDISLFSAVGAGIYAIHSLAYCFDVYRGECQRETNLFRLAGYISFLPSLNGIPLVTPKETLAAMKAPKIDSERLANGILLLLFGIVEKTVVGDRLAAIFDEMQEISGGDLSMLMSWFGAFIFGAGLFCRLKGLSHIAQGFALMCGIDTAPNFSFPYSQISLRDYLSSYNISAYNFVQRYFFRPLAGKDTGHARTLLASSVSIVAVCLSYNISASFLIWGTSAALLITIEMLFDHKISKLPKPVRYIFTHMLTIIGWAVVSQKTAVASMEYVSHMFTGALTLDTAPFLYFLGASAPFVILLVISELRVLRSLTVRLDSKRVSPIAIIKPVLTFALLVLCTVFLMSGALPHGTVVEV